MNWLQLLLNAIRGTGRSVSKPSEIRDLKKAIAEYYNAGYAVGDPKRMVLTETLDDWDGINRFLEVQHKQGFIDEAFAEEIGQLFDEARAIRNENEVNFDAVQDRGSLDTNVVSIEQYIPNELFRENLIKAFSEGEVLEALRIKVDQSVEIPGIKSGSFEDELVWLLEARNSPSGWPLDAKRTDGAASKYMGSKENFGKPDEGPKEVTNLGVQNEGEAMTRVQQMIDEVSNNEFLLKPFRDALERGEKFGIFNDAQRQQAVAYADEALAKLGTTDTSLKGTIGPEGLEKIILETKQMKAATQQILDLENKVHELQEVGETAKAELILDELRAAKEQVSDLQSGDEVPIIIDPTRKPHAKGGRVGLEGGGYTEAFSEINEMIKQNQKDQEYYDTLNIVPDDNSVANMSEEEFLHAQRVANGPQIQTLYESADQFGTRTNRAQHEYDISIRERYDALNIEQKSLFKTFWSENPDQDHGKVLNALEGMPRFNQRNGGRVGLESGGNPLDKMKMNRRGFIGLLGSGIAALAAGGKGLFTAAPKVAEVISTNAIPLVEGMPRWFPLLVNTIKDKGIVTRKSEHKEITDENINIVEYKLTDDSLAGGSIHMTENLITGEVSIWGRGDDYQQVDLTFTPGERMVDVKTGTRREGPPSFDAESSLGLRGLQNTPPSVTQLDKHPVTVSEEGTFEASEFAKGEVRDVENYGTIDDLRGGLSSWKTIAGKSNKITKEDVDAEIRKFMETYKGPEEPNMAKGGRVGLKEGGGNREFESSITARLPEGGMAQSVGFHPFMKNRAVQQATLDHNRTVPYSSLTGLQGNDALQNARKNALQKARQEFQNTGWAPPPVNWNNQSNWYNEGGRVGFANGGFGYGGSRSEGDISVAQKTGFDPNTAEGAYSVVKGLPGLMHLYEEQYKPLTDRKLQNFDPTWGTVAGNSATHSLEQRRALVDKWQQRMDEDILKAEEYYGFNPSDDQRKMLIDNFGDMGKHRYWSHSGQGTSQEQLFYAKQADAMAKQNLNQWLPTQEGLFNKGGRVGLQQRGYAHGGLTRTVPPQRGPLANGIGTRFKERQIWQ